MMYDITKPFWKSKKWWVAVIAALIPVSNYALGLDLDVAEVMAVITPLIAYVLGQSIVDAKH